MGYYSAIVMMVPGDLVVIRDMSRANGFVRTAGISYAAPNGNYPGAARGLCRQLARAA
jgi:hypothetical protein